MAFEVICNAWPVPLRKTFVLMVPAGAAAEPIFVAAVKRMSVVKVLFDIFSVPAKVAKVPVDGNVTLDISAPAPPLDFANVPVHPNVTEAAFTKAVEADPPKVRVTFVSSVLVKAAPDPPPPPVPVFLFKATHVPAR